jgi:Domain of unknown function (DUF4326)
MSEKDLKELENEVERLDDLIHSLMNDIHEERDSRGKKTKRPREAQEIHSDNRSAKKKVDRSERSSVTEFIVPKGVCVKVKYLRPTFNNLKEWVDAGSKHQLVTRAVRVFLTRDTVYHYPTSEFSNPYHVGPKHYSLEESLEKFRMHFDKLMENPDVKKRFMAMMGKAKEIGCFCAPNDKCHRDILIEKYKKFIMGEERNVERPREKRPREKQPRVKQPRKTPDLSYSKYAKQLHEEGYTVVPIYSKEEVKEMRKKFIKMLDKEMPEYNHDPLTKVVPSFKGEQFFVKGGFGALGNPSSFHHPLIRSMRTDAMEKAKKVFQNLREEDESITDEYKLEQLVDRARMLRAKASITPESWHRDTTPAKKMNKVRGKKVVLDDDLIFGGWIALDGPQKLSAIKNSHRSYEGRNKGGMGFSKLTKEQQEEYTKIKEKALKDKKDWFIEIPAGHMLIFQQELIHEVVKGTKRREPAYRLFTGWRLTKSDHTFLNDEDSFFKKQSVPAIKSDQIPDMYPSMPWSQSPASRKTLEDWSKTTFNPLFLEKKTVVSGKHAGETRMMSPKKFYSLQDVAIKLAAKSWLSYIRKYKVDTPNEFIKAAKMIVSNTPQHWRSKLDIKSLRSRGFEPLKPSIYRKKMFPKYSEEDKNMLKPMEF